MLQFQQDTLSWDAILKFEWYSKLNCMDRSHTTWQPGIFVCHVNVSSQKIGNADEGGNNNGYGQKVKTAGAAQQELGNNTSTTKL